VARPTGVPPTDERGQAAPLVVIVIAVLLAVVVGVARLGTAAAADAAAQAAADATALAAALDGQAAGEQVAAANHAAITTFRQDGVLVQVEVERAGRRAVATAERYLAVDDSLPDRAGVDGGPP
jgi:hypothetical protein